MKAQYVTADELVETLRKSTDLRTKLQMIYFKGVITYVRYKF